MEPHDFWNLAGRAGRWGDEFQGNIVCIDPEDSSAWPGGVPARARYPIKRESDAVIDLGSSLADYLDRRLDTDVARTGDYERLEQVGAYLLSTYLRSGSISGGSLAKRHEPAMISRLDESLAVIASRVEVTPEIVGRHPGVSALGLQNLLAYFRIYDRELENLLPAPADSQDSYDRFVTLMKRINKHLFPAFVPEGRAPLFALIVVQ